MPSPDSVFSIRSFCTLGAGETPAPQAEVTTTASPVVQASSLHGSPPWTRRGATATGRSGVVRTSWTTPMVELHRLAPPRER